MMERHVTKVTLDGISNGIGAFIRSRNCWLSRGDQKSNLFTNFKTIEWRLFGEDLDYHDVALFFIVQDKVTGKVTLSINEAIKTDTGWKIARVESIFGNYFLHIYDIQEFEIPVVTNIGYISTNKAGTHDPNKDPRFEYAKLKHIRSIVFAAASKLASYQTYACSVVKVRKGFELRLDKSSAVIHIWTNGKLMDYNTEVKKRRDNDLTTEIRCLPYVKQQDKYGSLYMFVTCDESEVNDKYTQQYISKIENELLSTLKIDNPDDEINYLPCTYQGKVTLNLSIEEV